MAKYNMIVKNAKKATKYNRLHRYMKDYAKCYDAINKRRPSAYCFGCDEDAQKYIDMENKTIRVTSKIFRQTIQSCYGMAVYEESYLVPLFASYIDFVKASKNRNFCKFFLFLKF